MKAGVTSTHQSLIDALLKARGLTDEADIEKFLHPSYDQHLHNPFLLHDMEKAVSRVLAAIETGERIAIYADFDCDGIPGASVLVQFFQKIEYENVETYIPHRHFEGYGLHQAAINILSEHGVKVIITVDVGTTALESIAHANTLGIDVIVTDHHEPPEVLPEACAIINPKFAPYPDPNLCGAATAFKLVQALIIEGKKQALPAFSRIQDGWEKWLLDLVGIATVADMVPLVGENRVLATYGLRVLRKSPRPGIVALMHVLRADQSTLTEDDIGFLIGPRINAASRMDEPELALRLLTTRNAGEAQALAVQLESLNKSRKAKVAAMTREINKRLHARTETAPVTVLGDPEWKPALLGLAANGALDTTGGVVCVWGRDGSGVIKGSCRSDGSVSVVELFRAAEDSLEEFGGHHAAGGFSVSQEKVHYLQETFTDALGKITVAEGQNEKPCAYRIPLSAVSPSLFDALVQVAPFGIGNEKPLFAFEGVTIATVRQFGKANEHLEVTLQDSGVRMKAIQFFSTPATFSAEPVVGSRMTVLAELERSTYRGSTELRLRLVDIASPAEDVRATIISI